MTQYALELGEELKNSLFNVVVADFNYYVSVCVDECFMEFFRVTDLTKASFFEEVLHHVQIALGALWWEACEYIASMTAEIQIAVFAHPWARLNGQIPH